MSPQVGPSLRRRQLAEQLTSLRDEAGLLTAQVAEHLRVDRSLVSHYEAGRRLPKHAELVMMLQLYRASDRLEDLSSLRDSANERGWWDPMKIPNWLKVYVSLEGDATRINRFTLELVPGMLQTADYARDSLTPHGQTPDATVEQQVTVRMKRREHLETGTVKLSVVMSEGLLRRTSYMGQIGVDQLIHLREASANPNVTLEVLPFATGRYRNMGASFTVMHFPHTVMAPMVYQEHAGGGLFGDDPKAVRRLEELHLELRDQAESPVSTNKMIDEYTTEARRITDGS